jgi:hypothetical protein
MIVNYDRKTFTLQASENQKNVTVKIFLLNLCVPFKNTVVNLKKVLWQTGLIVLINCNTFSVETYQSNMVFHTSRSKLECSSLSVSPTLVRLTLYGGLVTLPTAIRPGANLIKKLSVF